MFLKEGRSALLFYSFARRFIQISVKMTVTLTESVKQSFKLNSAPKMVNV